MKRFCACLLAVMIVLSLFTVAMAETVEYKFLCYTNEVTTGARAKKADSERKFYVRQESTSDDFPVYYTSRDGYGTVVSGGIYFAAGKTGRKSKAYHDTYTVSVGSYYKLGVFPYDGVYEGNAGLEVAGRWTP